MRPFDNNPVLRIARWCAWFLGAALLLAVATQGCRAEEVSTQSVAPAIDDLRIATPAPLDVTRDTPKGYVHEGGDITAALQWACSHAHRHRRAIAIPGGHWKLSETISTPYRSGLVVLGLGITMAKDNSGLSGAGTVLHWVGEPGKPMIRYTGTEGRVGGFCLDGAGRAEIGLLIDRPDGSRGIGTGKLIVEPLICCQLKYGIQAGTATGTNNCDNLRIEWLEGDRVEACYHGRCAMNMDVTIGFLRNYGANRYGVLSTAGGHLWVQSSLSTHATTLLRILDTPGGHGPNNAFFRLSHTKVDAQAGDGFTLVDSDDASEIRILADGGIQSNTRFTGTFARLLGSNFLHVTDFSSTFAHIECKSHRGWGKPAVLLEACRIWGWTQDADGNSYERPVSELFHGECNARVANCTRTNGAWLDWSSEPPKQFKLEGTAEEVSK